MSLRIQEASLASHATRRELLRWAREHYSSIARLRPLQSALIPKLSPYILSSITSFQTSTTHTQRLAFSSSHHYFNEHTTLTSTLEATSPESTSNRLAALMKTQKKSKTDIESIRNCLELLPAEEDKHNEPLLMVRYNALLLLLKYKRYDWVRSILERESPTDLSTMDKSLLIQARILSQDLHGASEVLQTLEHKERIELVALIVESLVEVLSKTVMALQLWIIAMKLSYPSMKVANQNNAKISMGSLVTIIERLEHVPSILEVSNELLPSVPLRKNFAYNLSFAYYKTSLPHRNVKLWEALPTHIKTSNLLANAIRAYTSLKEYGKAIDAYVDNPTLQNETMKQYLIPALTATGYQRGKTFQIICDLVKTKVISEQKFLRILGTLLHERRLKDFDELVSVYNTVHDQISITYHNLLLERQGFTDDPQKFFGSLRSIYDSSKKPTSKTFRLLFQQFARQGDINGAISLLDVLIQKKKQITIQDYSEIVEACARAKDTSPLPKVRALMKKDNITPNIKFTESLMSLNLSMRDYQGVNAAYHSIKMNKPTFKMQSIMMKTYLLQNKMEAADVLHRAISKTQYRKTPDYYLSQLEYYCFKGDFRHALRVLGAMRSKSVMVDNRHYRVLMHAYNRFGRYNDTILAYNMMASEGKKLDSALYYEVLRALVRLDIINKDNFERPTKVVDDLLTAQRTETLHLRGTLKFKSIKPLVKALIQFYRPYEAHRLMSEFKRSVPDLNIDENLTYMKQELLLLASLKKWGSYQIVFQTFQNRLKEHLVTDGIAPKPLKKIYASVIESIFKFYCAKRDRQGFARLFQDLIFVHKFTFDSNKTNWIVRRLLKNKITLYSGLNIVEKRLIGGYIAKRLVRSEMKAKRRRGEKISPFVYKDRVLKPYLALGYIYREEMMKILYVHILNRSRKEKKPVEKIVGEFTKHYPKTFKNLQELTRRLRKRERYMSSSNSKLQPKNEVSS